MLKLLLLVLFIGYYGSITLFPHIHHIGTTTIVHSHPYGGSDDCPNHSHTTGQYQTIQVLTALLLMGCIGWILPAIITTLLFLSAEIYKVFFLNRCLRHYSLRAPPAVA